MTYDQAQKIVEALSSIHVSMLFVVANLGAIVVLLAFRK
jgi:hypothetical protein